ncbi:MAG TPA: TIM barrel protein [Candidatus Rubrimentiphilum sp.]|nr:TIM barrel protein [Candidatus Rubrimentiphilum sp.]
MALELGLCSVTFRKLDYANVLELATSARVRGIEWGADIHVPAGDAERAKAVKAESAACGITVASYGSYVEAGVTSNEAFADVLATASALGAPNIRIWAGRRGIASTDVTARDRAKCVAALRAFAFAAAKASVTLSLEFHRETLTDSLDSTLRLLDETADPNVFTYWQPAYWQPERNNTAAAIAELEALRPRLSHLHIFNWGPERERLPLQAAETFWQPVLDRVCAWNDSSRYAFLEFVREDDPAAFIEDAATLRNWLE